MGTGGCGLPVAGGGWLHWATWVNVFPAQLPAITIGAWDWSQRDKLACGWWMWVELAPCGWLLQTDCCVGRLVDFVF